MFWFRNKKNDFQLCTLTWGPGLNRLCLSISLLNSTGCCCYQSYKVSNNKAEKNQAVSDFLRLRGDLKKCSQSVTLGVKFQNCFIIIFFTLS